MACLESVCRRGRESVNMQVETVTVTWDNGDKHWWIECAISGLRAYFSRLSRSIDYGGSTAILVSPEGTVEWDKDLVANSSGLTGVDSGRPVETLVRDGERIGQVV